MLSVHLRQFTWAPGRRVAAAEASSLQWKGEEILAVTTWTGDIITYTMDAVQWSAKGEILGWHFVEPSGTGCEILIFND